MSGFWLVGPYVNLNDFVPHAGAPIVRCDDAAVNIVFVPGPVYRRPWWRKTLPEVWQWFWYGRG